ncbi:unnamed protein product [Albugo candida]|uniref:Uncharacterized protein n=1 Tax=Albugo candida TaxID=65357 RepID=A0A024GVI4_9STRA|nr:unnamed protein product [Albugo candida]|eukprot:CCI50860.1 unnamed protein product [Albugo candida]
MIAASGEIVALGTGDSGRDSLFGGDAGGCCVSKGEIALGFSERVRGSTITTCLSLIDILMFIIEPEFPVLNCFIHSRRCIGWNLEFPYTWKSITSTSAWPFMTGICLSALSIIKISARSRNQRFCVYFICRVDLCSRVSGPVDSIFCSNRFFIFCNVSIWHVSIKHNFIRAFDLFPYRSEW